MRLRSGVFIVALVLLMAPALFGQSGLTGTLTGNVTQDGNPLPGVTVTVTSPQMQGQRDTVTNEAGGYNFASLPPGDYTIRYELSGLQPLTRTAKVGIAQTARVDAELRVSAVTEAITVTAASPAVAETVQVQTNFDQQLIDALPVNRTITAITGLSPGVVSGVNGLMISGGQSFDNLYTVDGAVIQENLRGQPHNLFIEDAIQETTVQRAGISAEFGNFTGGVVTAITRSGGNEFSGSLRDSLTNPDWTGATPNIWRSITCPPGTPAGTSCIESIRPNPNVSSINDVYEGTLGGRILRDRLWFFAAGRFTETDTQQNYANAGPGWVRTRTDTRMEAKLTGQITSRHNLVASMVDAPIETIGDCQITCFDESAKDPSTENPNRFTTLFYNGVITSNLLVEGKWTKKTYAFVGYGGDDHDRVTGTPFRLTAPGYSALTNEPFFCGDCIDEDRDNDALGFKASYFLGTRAMGSHNIIAGAERWHETRLADNYQSPSLYVFIAGGYAPSRDANGKTIVNVRGGANGDTMQYWPVLEGSKGSDLKTDSFYVNDKWDLTSRWSFNLGARYDGNDAKDSAGNKIARDSKISPRLGVTSDVFANGRLRINGSYAVYVGRLAETVAGAGSAAGNPARFTYRYQGPDIRNVTAEEALRQVWAWFDAQGGIAKTPIVSQNVPGATAVIEGGALESPNVVEYAIGASTSFRKGFIRADIIHRDWEDFYTTKLNLGTGKVTINGNLADRSIVTNTNDFERTYDALELQGSYNLTSRLQLGGNYTYSELWGNFIGESSGGGPGTEGEIHTYYPEYYNFDRSDMKGPLASGATGDQTHKVRAWGSFDMPTFLGNFNFSLLQRYDSGTPYSLSGSIDIRQSANFYGTGRPGGVVNPGYSTPPTSVGYYFSDRGEFRFDGLTATDVAVNYQTNASWLRGASLFAQAEVVNVFDEASMVSHNTSVLTHLNDPTLQRFNPHAGDKPVEGVHWRKGPLFGKPTSTTTSATQGSYQLPRTYRFSLGLRF